MIPVLGIPYINRPDLLTACLASIDEPVGRLIVVDNSPDGSAQAGAATHLAMRHNLGVAASWNLILKMTPLAPWWLLVNADIAFGPGDLARLVATVDDAPAIYEMWGFAAFALNRAALDALGYFDENFHPAQLEDDDYRRRIALAGIPRVNLQPNGVQHVYHATVKSDDHYRVENDRTRAGNWVRYLEKWGGPPDGGEQFTSPFNRPEAPFRWDLDPRRLREQTWT